MSADLHLHSTFSDGTVTPAELVRLAARAGLTDMALTDHDSLSGVEEAWEEGRRAGIRVLPGVEIGCDWRGREVHLLGLGVSPTPELVGVLAALRNSRLERGRAMVERLRALGLPLTWDEVLAESGGRAVGRPHLARVLKGNGAVRSEREAFDKYLNRGRPGYVERQKLAPAEAVRLVHAAGGLVFLAHPGLIPGADREELLGLELDGLEAAHPDHSLVDFLYFRDLARRRGLLVSAGTDFHSREHGLFPGEIRLATEETLLIRRRLDRGIIMA